MTLQDHDPRLPDPTKVLTDEQDAKRRELREQREAAERLEKGRRAKGKRIATWATLGTLVGGGSIAAPFVVPQIIAAVSEANGEPDDILGGGVIETGGEDTETSLAPFSAELAPEQLGQAWVDRMNAGFMAGCDEETYQRSLESTLSGEEFFTQEAEKNAIEWANATYGSGWEADEGSRNFVYNILIPSNIGFMQNWFHTHRENNPFKYEWTLDSQEVISQDGTTTELLLNIVSTNNAVEAGLADEDPERVEGNGRTFSARVVFVKKDGVIYETLYSIQP